MNSESFLTPGTFLEAHPSSWASNPAFTGLPKCRPEHEVSKGIAKNAAAITNEVNFIKFPCSQRVDARRLTGDELITLIGYLYNTFYAAGSKLFLDYATNVEKYKVDQGNLTNLPIIIVIRQPSHEWLTPNLTKIMSPKEA